MPERTPSPRITRSPRLRTVGAALVAIEREVSDVIVLDVGLPAPPSAAVSEGKG